MHRRNPESITKGAPALPWSVCPIHGVVATVTRVNVDFGACVGRLEGRWARMRAAPGGCPSAPLALKLTIHRFICRRPSGRAFGGLLSGFRALGDRLDARSLSQLFGEITLRHVSGLSFLIVLHGSLHMPHDGRHYRNGHAHAFLPRVLVPISLRMWALKLGGWTALARFASAR